MNLTVKELWFRFSQRGICQLNYNTLVLENKTSKPDYGCEGPDIENGQGRGRLNYC